MVLVVIGFYFIFSFLSTNTKKMVDMVGLGFVDGLRCLGVEADYGLEGWYIFSPSTWTGKGIQSNQNKHELNFLYWWDGYFYFVLSTPKLLRSAAHQGSKGRWCFDAALVSIPFVWAHLPLKFPGFYCENVPPHFCLQSAEDYVLPYQDPLTSPHNFCSVRTASECLPRVPPRGFASHLGVQARTKEGLLVWCNYIGTVCGNRTESFLVALSSWFTLDQSELLLPQIPTMFPPVDHAEGGDENQPHASAHNSTSTANQDVVAAQLAAMQQQFGVFQLVLAQLLARNNPGDPLINLLNPAQQPPAPQQNPQPVQPDPAISESQGQSHIAPAQQPIPDDVTRHLDSLEKLVVEHRGAPPPHHAADSIPHPLNTNITLEPYPAGFKIPQLETYDGTKDPDDHLHAFYSCMHAQNASDALMCKIFPSTLRGNARTWYYSLPPRSISSYTEMASAFATKFSSRRLIRKTASELMRVKQRDGESLKNYMSRFNDAVLEVSSFDQAVGIAAVISGLKHDRFRDNLIKHAATTFSEVNDRSLKFITAEEYALAQNPPPSKNQNPEWRDDNPSRKRMRMAQNGGPLMTSSPRFGRPNSTPPQQSADHGHTTEQCNSLRSELESLAQRGMLNEYVQRAAQPRFVREQGPQPQGSRNPPNRQGVGYQQNPPPLPPPARIIHMITGGLEAGGLSSKQRKLYVREVKHQNRAQKRKIDDAEWKNQPITFTSADLDTVVTPHNDPLVTSVMINNCEVQRVLVDTGSAPDIMYFHCFESLSLDPALLQKYDGPIYGFNNQPVPVEGVLTLHVAFGSGRTYVTPSVRFLVVKMASSFNIVIGRPTLTEIRAVVSQSHLCMKFPTPMGIATLRGNQEVARHCYITSVTQPTKGKDQTPEAIPQRIPDNQQVMGVEIIDNRPEDETRAAPVEDVKEVLIDDRDPSRKTQIGTRLNPEERAELIAFLRANNDVFAWTSADMLGIPNSVCQHKLSTNPLKKPVAQKRRLFGGERLQAIKEEVEKPLQAGFVRKVDYCEWVANPVLVKKANSKWRMCIDYTNLNQACPKDCYPMPSIDKLVEAASGNERLSLLDAYSGYHQVPMALEDEEKTSFYAGDAIYCYVMMPFGLKNAGATYQKMVTIVFRAQIGKNLEVYVDDIVVKSLKAEDHLAYLDETFNNLRKNRMRLNPAKCIFSVESGKFLGFMVSRRGIEVNPEKIRAIAEMEPPKSVKDIQRLTGRVAALHRFISKSADKCLPFFKIMRSATQKDESGKQKKFEWSQECQAAFEELKSYLSSPPLLTKAVDREILYLYLGISDEAISSVLVKEEARQQKPIYYISSVLHGAELRYPIAEKVALAVVTSARKLRPYFQSHPIIVLTDQPLRQILQKPECSGRLIKWAVELGEFEITFQQRSAIRAQALADFIVECTPCPSIPNPEPNDWTLYVDGASSNKGSGAGALLIGLEGYRSEHALKFNFDATNNMAEYEALLLGLQLALELKISAIQIYSDSQLVVNQINSICEVVDPVMVKYVALVAELKCKFQKFCLSKIPRAENEQADSLSKFASDSSLSSRSVFVEVLDEPSFMKPRMMEVSTNPDMPSWTDSIISFLRDGIAPENRQEAMKLRKKASRYTLVDGVLYKRSFSLPLLRCLNPYKVEYALQEKCPRCQFFAHLTHQPAEELTNLVAPWPFAQWGLDLLGPFVKGVGGVTHLVVGVDYFTKWVEARPLSSLTSKKVEDFVFSSIICRYGIPNQIFTSVYHLESNGMVESVNKCILEGETPYHLAFGTKAVIPVEIGVPSFRVTHFDERRNGQLLRENLDLLAEVREEARLRTLVYKQKLANFYNKRVRP
ncbi:hypothetical protein SLEP1_g58282 [Rubroshorea leprosula]|uniref:Uncharacterized protein n=1 Tax=Rubroshorea leprosula TaxID=152421 RepID=A0AAV5MQ34_9ROSI|nr:hypothetical protein SLEP1_g58282 [Rubroshorea leprosula]